ncbi:MAG: type VI secretion system lipoprotein TssJ [Enterobacteriaceae bacterium]|jgi:type VI secretion system protein VasD|nr:type VI secretion system lipoprotein TssJ [Enterobacteriaceae bacterium]
MPSIHRYLLPLFFMAMVTLLSGCETTQKIVEVIKDPNVPVGYPSKNPSEISLTLVSEPDMNPNQSGEATPIELQVVYLNDDSKFLSIDYDQILDDGPEKALGKNYVNHQDYSLLPGQFKSLPPIKLDAQTRFIGVIAHYSFIDDSQWYDITDVESVGKKENIMIHVRADLVEIRKEDK